MGYYDGNTVTALWNYAQHFAINDNAYGTTFGPSTVGAINLISGQTNGVAEALPPPAAPWSLTARAGTRISAMPIRSWIPAPAARAFEMSNENQNIGNLLNAQGVTWGWFEGGFDLSIRNSNGTTGCTRSTTSAVTGVTETDYIPHHEPFQYYASTANPNHLRPTSISMIGRTDQANHQYDINDFYAAVQAGNMPAVSFLKAPGFEDAHAGYSDPLDEQNFVVSVINFLMTTPRLVLHGGLHQLRRLRRLVRSSAWADREPVCHRGRHADQRGPLRYWNRRTARAHERHDTRAGPLRLRPAHSAHAHFSLGESQLC